MARFNTLKDNPVARNEMFQNYLAERLRNDPAFQQSIATLQREGRAVSVAIDLGIAYLRRGQELVDVDARRVQLEKAEKTFLRLPKSAGQTDEVKLSLGRVYYWLGKPDEGKKIFDELMKGPNVEQRMTIAIANILREVGAVAEARKLLEDNFEKDGALVARNMIARSRSVMMIDLDDRIAWLEKIQEPDRHDQAQLCAARGDKALADNRDADAERELRQAIAHYNALPVSTASLNNSAITHFSLYRLTGDLKELNAGIVNLEKAVALQPSDTILILNAADNVLGNSLREIIGNDIDLPLLRVNGNIDHLNYLARDNAKLEDYRHRIAKHEGIAKARAYFERLTVLAPKKAHSYTMLNTLMTFLEDRDGLKTLQARVARTDFDHSDVMRRILDAFQDKNLDKLIKETEHTRDYHEKRVTDARKVGGATLAVAIGDWQRDSVRLILLGKDDVPDLVESAEEAYKVAPSRATHRNLVDALFMRAHRELVNTDKTYQAMAKDGFRSLGASYLIAVAIDKEKGPRKTCLANKDVQRAMAMVKAQCDAQPEEFGEWTWALFRHTEPAWTAKMAKQLQANELTQTSRELAQHLTPWSAIEAYRQYWALILQGQLADADAVLQRVTEMGIPLPK
jgi:tetratricopeptide (TPR) repeat protein